MARVKDGNVARKRRKKVLKQASGYFGSKHTLYKTAHEQVMHSLQYAYRDRRQLKSDYRKLWIKRINAACHQCDINYSQLVHGLRAADISINRKMLSELAINDFASFKSLVDTAKKALEK
jgi:large subunit ribosomal protein L20